MLCQMCAPKFRLVGMVVSDDMVLQTRSLVSVAQRHVQKAQGVDVSDLEARPAWLTAAGSGYNLSMFIF
jgi:hypothetical protein